MRIIRSKTCARYHFSAMTNDFATSILEIARNNDTSPVEYLLEVQGQHMASKETSWQWVSPLKVLTLYDTHFANSTKSARRLVSSANHKAYFGTETIRDDQYIALSYVWNPAVHEEPAKYSWLIQSESLVSRPSEVRDTVLDRVVQYMNHYKVKHLWVDRECIDQNDQEARQQAMQSMDIVYSISDHPLAVLSEPIRTEHELQALESLLDGKLVSETRKRKRNDTTCDLVLNQNRDEHYIYGVLDLLYRLTSNIWWTRAWCFQEEYLAGKTMELLIPHHRGRSIVAKKQIFGKLTQQGDLVVSSYKFRDEATKFVFAYVAAAKQAGKPFKEKICRHILDHAGKYTLMGDYGHLLDIEVQGSSMSTLVLSDLHLKGCTYPSNILNIAANCNFYSETINTISLKEKRHSLSFAILTMWFSNGEIFWNNGRADPKRGDGTCHADKNVFEYLNGIAFNACPRFGRQGSLKYRRKSRFLSPNLSEIGVETFGHLFRVGWRIRIEADLLEASSPKQVLYGIADKLWRNHRKLADQLFDFINEKFDPHGRYSASSARCVMSFAAASLVSRLREWPYIEVGYLRNRRDNCTQGAGIFAVCDPGPLSQRRYVFTCWQEGSGGIAKYKSQPEEDKYVSLSVSVVDQSLNTSSPLLSTEGWADSLCFFDGAEKYPYTFPWPVSLLSSGHTTQDTALRKD